MYLLLTIYLSLSLSLSLQLGKLETYQVDDAMERKAVILPFIARLGVNITDKPSHENESPPDDIDSTWKLHSLPVMSPMAPLTFSIRASLHQIH